MLDQLHRDDTAKPMLSDIVAEQEIIGLLLRDNGVASRLDLLPDDFSDPLHQAVWELAGDKVRKGESFTVATIQAERPDLHLRLSQLMDYAGSLDARSCASSIKDFAGKRRLVEIADEILSNARAASLTANEAAAGAIGALSRLAVSERAKDKHTIATEIYEALGKPVERYSTGIAELDRVTAGGLYPGKLYGIAARMKVGKTTLLGTISQNLNNQGIKHLFVAGEMTPAEIERRNIARVKAFNGIQFLKRSRADLDLRQLTADYIAETPNATIYEQARGRKTAHDLHRMICNAVVAGAKGAIVDYLQLFRPVDHRQSFAEHLDELSQSLADLASEHGIFILIAAQLNQQEKANVRGGEGLRNAADWYATFHRCEVDGEEINPAARWLEVENARYCTYGAVGSNTNPGLWIDTHGPHVSESPPPYANGGG